MWSNISFDTLHYSTLTKSYTVTIEPHYQALLEPQLSMIEIVGRADDFMHVTRLLQARIEVGLLE